MASRPSNHKPQIALVVVIFTVEGGALQVLLIRRSAPPFQGFWALPGGVFSGDEALAKAAARRLLEETGLEDVYLEQLYTFGDLDPSAPAVAIGYFALVDYDSVSLPQRRDWPTAWFSLNDLPRLAFNNESVLAYALTRLRYKMEYTNVAYSLLPPYFTLSQLQKVYESILGKRVDKRNFRKRILALGLVRPTERTIVLGAHRPARLYAFSSRQPTVI